MTVCTWWRNALLVEKGEKAEDRDGAEESQVSKTARASCLCLSQWVSSFTWHVSYGQGMGSTYSHFWHRDLVSITINRFHWERGTWRATVRGEFLLLCDAALKWHLETAEEQTSQCLGSGLVLFLARSWLRRENPVLKKPPTSILPASGGCS